MRKSQEAEENEMRQTEEEQWVRDKLMRKCEENEKIQMREMWVYFVDNGTNTPQEKTTGWRVCYTYPLQNHPMSFVIAKGFSFTCVQRGTVWVKVLWTFKTVGHFSCAVVGNHFIVASITLTLIHSSPHSLLKSFCFQCIQLTFSVSTLQYCSLKPVN